MSWTAYPFACSFRVKLSREDIKEFGISLHWTNTVLDIDGNQGDLTQYSYIALKNDAIEWLTKNGRLPTTRLDQFFKEINTLNKQKKEIKELIAINQA